MQKDDFSLIDEIKKHLKEESVEQINDDSRVMEIFGSEIEYISRDTMSDFVKSILNRLWTEESEEYTSALWMAPASNIPGEHPPDEYGIRGLIIHTKRMTRIAINLCLTFGLSELERDEVIVACLLHDSTRAIYGTDGTLHYDSMHTFTVDALLESMVSIDIDNATSNVPNTLDCSSDSIMSILRLIRCSHGMDSPIPEVIPITDSEKIVAAADHLAKSIHYVLPDLFMGSQLYVGY